MAALQLKELEGTMHRSEDVVAVQSADGTVEIIRAEANRRDSEPPTPAAAPAAAGGQTVEAPMPGKILDIKVKVGDAVGYGQCVIVMEAMKMETEIVAPAAGTVASINVSTGDSVETGAVLVTLN